MNFYKEIEKVLGIETITLAELQETVAALKELDEAWEKMKEGILGKEKKHETSPDNSGQNTTTNNFLPR